MVIRSRTTTRRGFLSSSIAGMALGLSRGLAQQLGKYDGADILIVGAGLGGVAAALAAAQAGCRVILTEETAWIGGQATTQGVPLDEHPWIETEGRTARYAEFRHRVREYYRTYYPLSAPAKMDPRLNPGAGWVSACCFEPRAGLSVLYEMLAPHLTSGAIRLFTLFRPLHAAVSGDHVRAVSFLNLRTGKEVLFEASQFLDATELGDLLPLAGVEFVTGSESSSQTNEPTAVNGPAEPLRMQGLTHVAAVDYLPGEDHVIAKPQGYEEFRPRFRPLVGIAPTDKNKMSLRQRRLFAPGQRHHYEPCIWNFRRVFCRANFASGSFPSDVTMLMTDNECDGRPLFGISEVEAAKNRQYARQLSLSLLYYLQTEISPGYQGKPGYPGLRPRGDVFGTDDGLAQYPYIREARRIKASFTILEQHFRIDQRPHGPLLYPDSVGLSGYRMDIHEKGSGGRSLTLELNGKHWTQQIPLGAMIPIRVENLLPAAKNIGTTHVTNGAFRVHPAEWSIGEAAGYAAAFCIKRRARTRQVRQSPTLLADFQRELIRNGISLKWKKPKVAASYNSLYANVPGWYFGEAYLRYDRGKS